jgi:hypothetical protein
MINLWKSLVNWIVITIGKVHWGYRNGLTKAELNDIRRRLIPHYYIIVTRRNNHLSTYFVSLANLFVNGKWSYWAHTLMNLEDEVKSDTDFRLIESTGTGVHYSTFDSVFQVHGVALLKPKSMPVQYWTDVMDKAMAEIGKPYDSLFDLRNDNALSCVELVRTALMAEPNYETNFANFEEMIKSEKNLTPQMFYDCPDFEVAYEIRH